MMPADTVIAASIVDEQSVLSLEEMSRMCAVEARRITELVDEGILAIREAQAGDWLFAGTSVRRARLALRLHRDLEINLAGVALALDLMDDIEQLRRELRRGR